MVCLLALSATSLYAGGEKKKAKAQEENKSAPCERCHLGVVGFAAQSPDQWYTLHAPTYPDTVLLSQNADRGSKQGKIQLNSEGLKIYEPGNYSVTFTAILLNNDPNNTPLVPIYLVRNGIFDPSDTLTLGNMMSLQPGIVTPIQLTGILENVAEDTAISLRTTNGSGSSPQDITVLAWDISVFKMPCGASKSP